MCLKMWDFGLNGHNFSKIHQKNKKVGVFLKIQHKCYMKRTKIFKIDEKWSDYAQFSETAQVIEFMAISPNIPLILDTL